MSIRYTRNSEAVEIHPEEIGIEAEEDEDSDAEMEDDQNRADVSEDRFSSSNVGQTSSTQSSGVSKSRQPYIRTFVFSRDVPIRIDYCAKYLDLSQVIF